MKWILLCLPLGILGCEALQTAEDEALGLLSQGVDRYCSLSETGRAAVREKADAATAPRKVRIEGC